MLLRMIDEGQVEVGRKGVISPPDNLSGRMVRGSSNVFQKEFFL